jgi:D-sedoheptulose 7-phosphate isomerase
MSHTAQFLTEVAELARRLEASSIDARVEELRGVGERGDRAFVLGVGGSAANATHFVNDPHKL